MQASAPDPLLVACLCARWCGVCGQYRERFDEVGSRFPQARFLWIDVEDDADLLHPLDVEDFPTLLIAVGAQARFFGPVAPHAQTLERLIRTQLEDAAPKALSDPVLTQVLARVRAEKGV